MTNTTEKRNVTRQEQESRDGAVVKYSPPDNVVLVRFPIRLLWGFFSGLYGFLPPQVKSGEEPLCGNATAKFLFILFI